MKSILMFLTISWFSFFLTQITIFAVLGFSGKIFSTFLEMKSLKKKVEILFKRGRFPLFFAKFFTLSIGIVFWTLLK